jgi:hypothetical protein
MNYHTAGLCSLHERTGEENRFALPPNTLLRLQTEYIQVPPDRQRALSPGCRLNDSSLSGNELFGLGTRNLKTGHSALLRFLWSCVENVWIQFPAAGLRMAMKLPQV